MGTNYRQSSHKWAYIWIGLKHWVSPQMVYDLAHGNIDYKSEYKPILHDLKVKGIIRRTKSHRSEEDE